MKTTTATTAAALCLVAAMGVAGAFAPEASSTKSSIMALASTSPGYGVPPPPQDYEPTTPPPPPPLGPTLNGWTPDATKPCYGLPGAIPPLGYFDPLGLCNGRDLCGVKRMREAEVVHGRVAMLATVGILLGENAPTLAYGMDAHPTIAIHQIDEMPKLGLLFPLFMFVNVSEALRANRGWVEPWDRMFALRESYYPGDVKFDPLGIKPDRPDHFADMASRELSHGRLAMLAATGMVVQEVCNGKPVLEDLVLPSVSLSFFD